MREGITYFENRSLYSSEIAIKNKIKKKQSSYRKKIEHNL